VSCIGGTGVGAISIIATSPGLISASSHAPATTRQRQSIINPLGRQKSKRIMSMQRHFEKTPEN